MAAVASCLPSSRRKCVSNVGQRRFLRRAETGLSERARRTKLTTALVIDIIQLYDNASPFVERPILDRTHARPGNPPSLHKLRR